MTNETRPYKSAHYVINHTPENTTIVFAGQGEKREDATGDYSELLIATE